MGVVSFIEICVRLLDIDSCQSLQCPQSGPTFMFYSSWPHHFHAKFNGRHPAVATRLCMDTLQTILLTFLSVTEVSVYELWFNAIIHTLLLVDSNYFKLRIGSCINRV